MIFKYFAKEHLEDATHLFVERQKREKQHLPFLKDFLPSDAKQALSEEWSKPDTKGIVAFQGERMVGYLFGRTEVSKERGRVGFEPYMYRFSRSIDERIAWTKGESFKNV
ncbi:hypothetical protein [Litchfieldia alkalitelluris]|uniref:hypothetical protein n=1 Tax=Litchfieldia alkalitelluris TaxID=304268 RepID=UPI0009973BF1|nr:hypothetical protein [Litchfieldia alkalitelluris]